MKQALYFLTLVFSLNLVAQETSLDNYTGDWGNNSSWSGGWTDGSPAFLDLPESAADITIQGNIRVGSSSSAQNLTFATNNEAHDFTVNDTLIVYGDVDFANKSMNLVLGDGAVLIILGDLDMNNKINIASGGTLVVSGNFNKSGSQGSYTGDGNVYAGSFSGDAEATIDDGTGGDSSFTIDELSDDDFDEIEEFVIGSGTTPLPVDLLYFNVKSKNGTSLSWATATEINNDFFSIERSEDGEYFYEIGRIDGNGDSNKEITYEFIDKFVLAPIEYYRLKQVDFDGQFEYFEVRRIATELNETRSNILAYPTIIHHGRLSLTSTNPYQIQTITFYNLSGGESKSLFQKAIQENPLTYQVDVAGLKKGIYLLKVTSSAGDQYSSRIIIE